MLGISRNAWLATAIAALGYAGTMAAMLHSGAITVPDVLRNIGIAIGWVLAVVLATSQFRASSLQTEQQKKADRRADLNLDAFKHIAAASTDFTRALAGVMAPFSIAAVTFRSPQLLPGDNSAARLVESARKAPSDLYGSWAQFVFSIEAYQIVLLPFDHLRHYIGFCVQDAADEIGRFAGSIPAASVNMSDEDRASIGAVAGRIASMLFDLQSFVGDYRVEVMNALTADLFDRHISRRRPLSPSKKTLVELATRETVDREHERRVQEAILNDPARART